MYVCMFTHVCKQTSNLHAALTANNYNALGMLREGKVKKMFELSSISRSGVCCFPDSRRAGVRRALNRPYAATASLLLAKSKNKLPYNNSSTTTDLYINTEYN